MVLGWSPRPSRTNTQKRYSFHHRGLEYKNMKSRDTWNNRKVWPWSTKQRKAKANRVLPREWTGRSKYLFPTTQEMTLYMDFTRWSIPKSDWLYSFQEKMEKLYTISKKTWLGADCGSDHEFFMAKFGLKLKKVEKTTRPSGKTKIKSPLIIQWKWQIDSSD